jgi:polyisoprenoid-binding protein YceI
LALCLACALPAQAETYKLDPVHSQVIFFINHLGFSNSSGKFHIKEGTVDYDAANLAKASVKVSIETSSLDMGDATWKEHLSSERFFDVAKFPTMEFQSTKVEAAGEGKLKVTGNLTLHGVTKPVTLSLELSGLGPDAYGGTRIGLSAKGSVLRSEFDMTFHPMMETGGAVVSDKLDVHIEVEGVLQQAQA